MKKHGAGPNLLYLSKITIITNFLEIFSFFFFNFPLLDPDPGGEINADPDAQPWMIVAMTTYNLGRQVSLWDG